MKAIIVTPRKQRTTLKPYDPATKKEDEIHLVSPIQVSPPNRQQSQKEEVQVLNSVLNPNIDYPHARFDCGVHKFSNESASLYCPKCFCYICDKPVIECENWSSGEMHCYADGKDPIWREKKRKSSISQETSHNVNLLQSSEHANKKVKELKEILRENSQHVTGTKSVLLGRIRDGERYGRLGPCPECSCGRLKVMDDYCEVVFCPGYYDGTGVVPCDYWCAAEEAPRLGRWITHKQEMTCKHSQKVRILMEKKRVSEMKEILKKNKQHVTGNKKTLLKRIIDGYTFGRLGRCPTCKSGRLKVAENENGLIVCHGHYDWALNRPVPCSFRSTAEDAPRVGTWCA